MSEGKFVGYCKVGIHSVAVPVSRARLLGTAPQVMITTNHPRLEGGYTPGSGDGSLER